MRTGLHRSAIIGCLFLALGSITSTVQAAPRTAFSSATQPPKAPGPIPAWSTVVPQKTTTVTPPKAPVVVPPPPPPPVVKPPTTPAPLVPTVTPTIVIPTTPNVITPTTTSTIASPTTAPTTVPGTSPVIAAPAPRFAIGVNLTRVSYYSSEWVFSNAMKMAGGWAQVGPTPRPQWVTTDADLWPIQPAGSNEVAQTLFFRDIKGKYPAGRYTATWEGQGDVSFSFDARTDWATAQSNSVQFDVTWPSDAGVAVRITNSNPANHVRNLKVQVPGAGTGTFDQRFLNTIKPFYVLRFMDWQRINDSLVVNWSERPLPSQGLQTYDNGVAIEYMIELCNTTGADPWLCVPHLASDDYVRQMATLVKSRLDKGRNVYIEYSNEVWNDSFQQAQWALQQCGVRGMIRPYVYADEAKRVFRIWHEVWGADKGRVIRVAAGHEAVPWTAERIMERLNGEVDAVSCAGYFYPMDEDLPLLNSSTTAADLLAMCMKQIKNEAIPLLKQHKTLADTWSVKLKRPIQFVAYEGGQHLYTTTDLPWGQAGIDAQNHPMMAECYKAMLDGCKAMDMRVYMAYNSVMPTTRWGAWGALEYQDQPVSESQKMTTLLKYTGRR